MGMVWLGRPCRTAFDAGAGARSRGSGVFGQRQYSLARADQQTV